MTQYLLSVCHAEPQQPFPEDMSQLSDEMKHAMQDVDALNKELLSAGAWVFAGGLYPPSSATVVRVQGGEFLITDGPFAEGKEQIGGFWVITAPDLDAALDWGRKATRASRFPVEVRPFMG